MSTFYVPIEIAFNNDNKFLALVNIFIDCVNILDLVLSFFIAYHDNEENLICNHFTIIKRYFGWYTIISLCIL